MTTNIKTLDNNLITTNSKTTNNHKSIKLITTNRLNANKTNNNNKYFERILIESIYNILF